MFKQWKVDLDSLQKENLFKGLSSEEQQKALTIASEISLEISADQLTAKYGKRSSSGSYKVKHTSESGFQLETSMDGKSDTVILRLNGETLLLKSARGELLLK